jgi:hypothetical protein
LALVQTMNRFRSSVIRLAATLGAVAGLSIAVVPGGFASAAKPPKPKPPKPPPAGGAGQLSIGASPGVVVFGRASAVSGQLTGVPSAVGTALSLDESPYPFKSFKRLAAGSTGGGGEYSFTVTPGSNTRYRLTAQTSPPTTSAEVDVLVKWRVSIRARGSRISGLVSPAHDGGPVALQRRSGHRYRTVAAGRLSGAGTAHSRYRFTVHRAGVYRARVPADADHLTGTSSSRRTP